MEETVEHNGNSITVFSEDEVEEGGDMHRGTVFSELKQHTLHLLELLRNPKKNPTFLPQLLSLLQRSHPRSLQKLFDYTLFPLLLLFDAAVNCRSTERLDSEVGSLESNVLKTKHNVSDSVAEGVVLCLEEVLKKCYVGSINQMVVILKKLAYGAMLSPSEASEEFREGVIRCLKALMLNLCPCADESCTCKQTGQLPVLQAADDPGIGVSKSDFVPEECLLSFLQSESASAAVGHWLSLLLKAADTEATRGHRGSSRLRIEALVTLRVLVSRVGAADALAFYLPGIVSQVGKVLHVSRTMISGAAGSSDALDQAIRCLAEYLMIVLEDTSATLSNVGVSTNKEPSFVPDKEISLSSFLEELRHLPAKHNAHDDNVGDATESVEKNSIVLGDEIHSDTKVGSLRIKRTEDWVANTTAHVNKLLCATFPHLCIHPSRKVRAGVLAAVKGLLCKCSFTLKDSRLMLLECLCVLVCDESEEVSSDAQTFFQDLASSEKSCQVKNDIVEIFGRLIEKLPQVILGNEESHALSHSRKLLAVTYFCGPRLVADYLLQSPVKAARFLDVFTLCLSQNSVYAGSLSKIASTRSSSSGFMHSISEIRAVIADHGNSGFTHPQSRKALSSSNQELPSMPPWFTYVGGQKLYEALAGILRLVSLFVFTDSRFKGSYSFLIDLLLAHLRKLISELRTKEHKNEAWPIWYKRTGSGHLIRQASTAACILNEMVFGLSEQSIATFNRMFQSSQRQEIKDFLRIGESKSLSDKGNQGGGINEIFNSGDAKSHLIDCIGSILHEYLAPEVWDLPLGFSASGEDGEMSLHFFDDNATMHQVIIEGVGVFGICLGSEFSSCGFLHSSLYMLLENIICSNFQVRRASDTVLRAIAASQDYPTVGHLVLANSDYVIDSVCRQLRHLDLNPHVPSVLSAMLSYVGVADKMLPLLEEPMRAVSTELEILGRHRHPNLTLSFLKAVAEIVKATKHEALKLPDQAESYKNDITSRILSTEKRTHTVAADAQEEWESVILKLNDSKRYRRIVGSIAGSCLVSVTPLVSSTDAAECLTALLVIEEGIFVLAKVEEAHKYETETKEAITEFLQSQSLYSLVDALEASDDVNIENRLLPAMNKIWPFLVACFRNKNLVAIRRCCETISKAVRICGGDFFSRRFHTDGSHFWKLLSTSPFHNKPLRKDQRAPLQLPFRKSPTLSEEPVSEISNLKVQESVLNMIASLAENEQSAPSLRAVLKKVSGVVTAIACSGVKGLQEASISALAGLAKVDSDLIWLLLADVYYSRKKNLPCPPPSDGLFPEISEVLPPPSSPKEYLYVMYGGQSFGFDVDFGSVESVFSKLHGRVFTSQMYT